MEELQKESLAALQRDAHKARQIQDLQSGRRSLEEALRLR